MTLKEILDELNIKLISSDEALDLVEGIMWRHTAAHVAAEREACAKVCENHPDGLNMLGGAFATCAAAIRARSDE